MVRMPTDTLTAVRRMVVCALLALAVVPAAADAKIIELGLTSKQPVASCPA